MLKPEELLTPAQILEFETKYGEEDIAIVRKRNRRDAKAFDWEIVLRRPATDEYHIFKSRALKESSSARANEMLVKQVLVYPDAERFNDFLKRWPGICESTAVNAAIQELCGLTSDELEKA